MMIARRYFLMLAPAFVGGCATAPRRAAMAVVDRPVNVAQAASLVTRYRAARGLGPVRADTKLTALAASQARIVARDGELSHGDFFSRMSASGVNAAVENLAMGATSVPDVIAQWKASPDHDRNLLKPAMTRVGLARADSTRPFWAMILSD